MTKAEQVQFVWKLIETVRKDLMDRCGDWPDEWEGHELRRLIVKRFELSVMGSWSRSRARAFNNECLVRNLP